VSGCDKQLYWRFDAPEGEIWLINMDQPDAEILGTLDHSAGDVLRPQVDGLESFEARRSLDAQRRAAERGPDPSWKQLPAAYNIPGVPYHYQITSWYCGPTSLQMLMNYWGEEIPQVPISDVANDVDNWGVYSSDLRRSAHFSGMSTSIQDPLLVGYPERLLGYASIDGWVGLPGYLRRPICQNHPVLILTWYDASHTSGHFRIVKGYDDNLSVFILHDPWYGSPFYGPDLLMDQTFLMDDLLPYSGSWGMVAYPWVLVADAPGSVAEGDTFSVDLKVRYPGPPSFEGQDLCANCEATIHLPAGMALVSKTNSVALPGLASGDSAVVSWDVIATGSSGEYEIGFQAQGIITGWADSYPSYSDSIGGHGLEMVTVGEDRPVDWPEEIRLTDDPASSGTCFPGGRAMVLENDGTAHVVWADTRDGNSEIYYRSGRGGTWSPPTRLTNDPAYSVDPAIATDENGNLHVAWVDTRDGNQEIYYKSWDGSVWSTDQLVNEYVRPDVNPTIAAGGGGVYLAWEIYTQGMSGYEVAFSALTDSGWTNPMPPDAGSAAGKESYRPSLAWGADGLLHLVYERQSAILEMEKIRHRSWDGVSWSPKTVLATDAAFSRGPVIAAGEDSTLHVVWHDGENLGGDIFYAKYDGTAWQATESIVSGGTEVSRPSVAVDGSGGVHVVWEDYRYGESKIFLMSHDGSGWSDPVRLSEGDGVSILPTVTARGSGEISVVWTDFRHGEPEIYFRTNQELTDVAELPFHVRAGGPVRLSIPYPMPFAQETHLSFSLNHSADLLLEVFDVHGRRVRTLVNGFYGAGDHPARWDGRDSSGNLVAPGVYFIRCGTARGADVKRVVLVR
jgi:hypothetical protein